MLKLLCPRCQHPAVLPPEMAGKPYQCTACEATLKIPGPKPAAPAPAAPAKPTGIPPDHYGVKCPKCLTPVLIPKSMSGMDYECTECHAILKVPGGKKPAPQPLASGGAPDLPPLNFVNATTDSVHALFRHGNILTYYGVLLVVGAVLFVLFVASRYLDLRDANLSMQLMFNFSPGARRAPISFPGIGPRILMPLLLLFWVIGQSALSHHALRGDAINLGHFRSALPIALRAIRPYFFYFTLPWVMVFFLTAFLSRPNAPIRSEQELYDVQLRILLIFASLNLLFHMTLGLFFYVGFNNELVARPGKPIRDILSTSLNLVAKNYLRIVGYTSPLIVITAIASVLLPPSPLLLAPLISLVSARIYFGLVAEAEARGD